MSGDAAILGRLLAARADVVWRKAEIGRALGWDAQRVFRAASRLRRGGAFIGKTMRLQPGWSPPIDDDAGPSAPARTQAPLSLRLLGEMMALHRRSRARALDHRESERLGVLVQREQQQASARPATIALLRAALSLLEELEIAEHGEVRAAPVDLVRLEDGRWGARQAEAA